MIYLEKVKFANTIYSKYPFKNAGGDEQLTLKCIKDSNESNCTRILLAPFQSKKYSNYDTISLCLYPSYANLQTSQEFYLDCYQIKITDNVMWTPGFNLDSYEFISKDEGSSWNCKTSDIRWNQPGGDFENYPFFSISCSYRNVYDILEIDNTSILNKYGILIKYRNENANIGYIRYYSPNTTTIFYPRYKYYINDYFWTESSYSIENIQNYIVSIPNIQLQYQQQEIVRFYLKLIPKMYSRDWTSSYWKSSLIQYTLNPTMLATYCLYDVTNIEKFKVFDHNVIYTRLSCNGQKNYFDIDMEQLPKNRFYQFQIKINNKIYPVKERFKIV